jgi:hypothetical protein
LPQLGPLPSGSESHPAKGVTFCVRLWQAGGPFPTAAGCLLASRSFFWDYGPFVWHTRGRDTHERRLADLPIPNPIRNAEHWCLTAKMARVLRAFHHRCMRSMCRLNLWHTRHNHVNAKTSTLATRLGIQTIETYIARRQVRWPGHVWRMPETRRLPKQLLKA